ncbi:hypothetical protein ACHHYP_08594 [Achlya hypogyna]|uniref:Helicase-associated domain-containing protein n=1 Tax=Achlya hypogyna TaxID=1202772 RepID=A0A1V9ZKF8_ACHHY|nr:hypothetical protein ACHHYP_08594 [Achlya hypogyna]
MSAIDVYCVPTDDGFPAWLHGKAVDFKAFRQSFKRGALPAAVVHEATRLGFVWDDQAKTWSPVLEALHNFKHLHNHLSVPKKFVVPATEAWPKHLWYLPLGDAVRNIRHSCPPELKPALNDMGFTWRALDGRMHTAKLTMRQRIDALKLYKALHGHMTVPTTFDVPATDEWPEKLWHFRLGSVVSYIRSCRDSLLPEHKIELDELGFVWDPRDERWASNLQALAIYKRLHGHVNVPQTYCVQSNDPQWPERYWGTKLGYVVMNIRRGGAHLLSLEREAELNALGFVWRNK